MTTPKDFQFAMLNQEQLKDLLAAEDKINETTTDPVYLLAFRKED